jgi:hypothetical protein
MEHREFPQSPPFIIIRPSTVATLVPFESFPPPPTVVPLVFSTTSEYLHPSIIGPTVQAFDDSFPLGQAHRHITSMRTAFGLIFRVKNLPTQGLLDVISTALHTHMFLTIAYSTVDNSDLGLQ